MKKLVILLTPLVLLSCATGYRTINPEHINYGSTYEKDGVSLEYKYEVLEKKYAKKERKKGIRVVAVKLKNTTDKELKIGTDLNFTGSKGNEISLLDNQQVFKPLKQNVATYFLYLLLTPLQLTQTTENPNGFTEVKPIFPIGLILGPGITLLNAVTAGTANKKFKDELNAYNFFNKTIKAGETAHGIIGIRSEEYDALKLSFKK